jgi:hypothetical protein
MLFSRAEALPHMFVIASAANKTRAGRFVSVGQGFRPANVDVGQGFSLLDSR